MKRPSSDFVSVSGMPKSRVEFYRALYTAVGQMTIRWAGLELVLDDLVRNIFPISEASDTEIPRSLKRKVNFLKRTMDTTPRLAPFWEDGRALARRIKKGSEDRNWIIHGVVADVAHFEATGDLTLNRVTYQETNIAVDTKTFTVKEIDGFTVQFHVLMNELARFQDAVLEHLDKTDRHGS